MKLRIKGNSLRLRLGRSEVNRLLENGRIEDTIHFAPAPDAKLTYALEIGDSLGPVAVRYRPQEVAVVVSLATAKHWAATDEITIAGESGIGNGMLAVVVEKDFACLDRSEHENEDTFPNPKVGAVC